MTREEAKKFWLIRYENAKDFNDPNWEAQERREHREYVEALAMAIEALQKEIERQERIIRASERYLGLVRCKDCRHCSEYYDRDGYPYWICDEWDSGTDADGFCHYGERKES